MFTNFRNDDTQKIFTKFLKHAKKQSCCYGFKNNGVLVLTTDYVLADILYKEENKYNLSRTFKDDVPPKIEAFNFGGLLLDIHQKLSSAYSNAIYIEQGPFLEDYAYTPGEKGGEKTLIVSISPDSLKRFIDPILKKHSDEFHILQTHIMQPEPPLIVDLIVNNNKINTLINQGCYVSTQALRELTQDITYAIDNAQKVSGQERN